MAVNNKKILILLGCDIATEQRVNKTINSLIRAGNKLILIDMPNAGNTKYCGEALHYPIKLFTSRLPKTPFFWMIKYFEYIIRSIFIIILTRPGFIHCIDRLTLIPGGIASLITNTPLIYDSQEIWPETSGVGNSPRFLWLIFEQFFAKRARRILVTDKFRLDITAKLLKLDREKISCLMNVPLLRTTIESKSDIRMDSGFYEGRVLAYAGNLAPNRHLEDIVLSLRYLNNSYRFVAVGFGDKVYVQSLVALAHDSGVGERVRFLNPVKWNELSSYIATADCTFALYEKNTLNNTYCSPSKIFDSFLVGVPVVTTDNPLILDLARKNDGVECIEDVNPSAIALGVKNLFLRFTSNNQRKNLIATAKRDFTWEAQEEILTAVYKS